MKRCLLLLVLFLFGNSFLKSQDIDKVLECPVEGIEWGMSYDKVEELTGAVKFDSNTLKKSIVDFINTEITFKFASNKLRAIGYYYTLDSAATKHSYDLFKIKEEEMIEKYGPAKTKYTWKKEEKKHTDEERYNASIDAGDLIVVSKRARIDGEITHTIGIYNDRIEHTIHYIRK